MTTPRTTPHPTVRLLLASEYRSAVVTLEQALAVVRARWGVEPGMPVLSSERATSNETAETLEVGV